MHSALYRTLSPMARLTLGSELVGRYGGMAHIWFVDTQLLIGGEGHGQVRVDHPIGYPGSVPSDCEVYLPDTMAYFLTVVE